MAYNSGFYETSGYYGKASLAEHLVNPGIRAKFDTLLRQLALKARTSFTTSLDIGCGGSPFTRLVVCAQRIYVDLSFVALRNLTGENPVQADLAHLPFRASKFQLMVGTDVLEHLPRDDLAVRELGRVAKKSGVLLLTVPHNPSLWSSSDTYEGHFRRYSVEDLVARISPGGFVPLSTFKVYGAYWIMRAVQIRDQKKNRGKNLPQRKDSMKKTPAEFVLSDMVNVLRILTRSKFFLALYNPLAKLISRFIMLDARLMPFSKICEMGVIAQRRGVPEDVC